MIMRRAFTSLVLVMSAAHAVLGQTIPRLGGDFEELWVTETEFSWTEGPAYDGVGGVWFADTGRVFNPDPDPNRVLRFDIASGTTETVIGFDEDPGATGLAFDDMGRLVAANAFRGMATRRSVDQLDQVEVLFDNFQGMPVRPNDLAIDSQGGIYFSNPSPPGDSSVLYLPPTGDVRQVATGLIWSNGIGLSPDGETLYVAQSPIYNIIAYDVNDDHTLSNKRVFAEVPGGADGMTVDRFGNVFSSDVGWQMGPPADITGLPGSMVRVFNPAGEEILTFEPPQGVINMTFGAPDDTLYIAAWNSLYRVPITYVPEPSSAALLGLGLIGLFAQTRAGRRRV